MRLGVFWDALALLIVAPLAVFPDNPKTTITVTVTNQFEKPVDNAAVILDFLGSHQVTKLGKRKAVHWEVHTNQHGVAHFPPVPQGTIQLQVIKMPQYQTFGQKFELDAAEKKIDIELKPPQQQYSAHPPLKPADATPPKQ